MSKKWISGLIVLIVVLGLGFFFLKYNQSKNLEVSPRQGDVVETIYGLGTVVSDQVYHVRAGIGLSLQDVFVQEGETVKAGTKLLKLDEFIQKTPIDGVVTGIVFKKGELVPAQASLLTVTNLKTLFLEASLEQQSVLRVKKDQLVKVSFESIRSEKLEGVVVSIYPREKQFIVRVDLPDWPEGVLPGMTADLAIVVGQKSQVTLVPLAALSGGKMTRLRNGKKEKVDVTIGAIDDNWAEVTSKNIELSDSVLVQSK